MDDTAIKTNHRCHGQHKEQCDRWPILRGGCCADGPSRWLPAALAPNVTRNSNYPRRPSTGHRWKLTEIGAVLSSFLLSNCHHVSNENKSNPAGCPISSITSIISRQTLAFLVSQPPPTCIINPHGRGTRLSELVHPLCFHWFDLLR